MSTSKTTRSSSQRPSVPMVVPYFLSTSRAELPLVPPENPKEEIVVLKNGDAIFGYFESDKSFVPHRYGGPARIMTTGAVAFYEHGVWLWSIRPDGYVWWSKEPAGSEEWPLARGNYQVYRVRCQPKRNDNSKSDIISETMDWPLSIPRQQRTPQHPGAPVDDRAYER